MDQANPTPHVGGYVSTAPCAEVGLTTGETCQFGYLNLGRFHADGNMPVDLDALAQAVAVLVRALDDAVEASLPFYPHPLSARVMTAKRKIGVGICGLADLLLQARLPYDSKEGRDLARDVIAFVNYASKLASASLAESRGPSPPSAAASPGTLTPRFSPGLPGSGPAPSPTRSGPPSPGGSRPPACSATPPRSRSLPLAGALP